MKSKCIICNRNIEVDRCHIKTRGSGGTDDDWNILLMCRLHHNEQHSTGFYKMSLKYPHLLVILKYKGWEFVDEFGVMKLKRI